MVAVRGSLGCVNLAFVFDRTRPCAGATHSRLDAETWQDPRLQRKPESNETDHEKEFSHRYFSLSRVLDVLGFHVCSVNFLCTKMDTQPVSKFISAKPFLDAAHQVL